jgi:phosphatidylinositol alpha-1,6-mannosyltransferase
MRGALSVVARRGSAGNLSILLFHKVPQIADPLVPDELCLTDFEQILDFLQTNTRVLPLMDAVDAIGKGSLPSRAVAITFDDGYAEWMQNVAPALARRSLPATFFITTEIFGGTVLWHERIVSTVRALPEHGAQLPYGFGNFRTLSTLQSRQSVVRALQERLKYVPLAERLATISMLEAQAVSTLDYPTPFTAQDARDLHSQGFDIGAHTIQHPILNESSDSEALSEIGGSKEQLESVIGGKVRVFAYPNGRAGLDFQGKHVEMAKLCGYRAAVTSSGGVASRHSDIFQLPRTSTWGNSHPHMAYHLARNRFVKEKKVFLAPAGASAKSEVRCLLIASTFAPIHGGSAVVYQNLCMHMPAGSIRVLAASHNYLNDRDIPGWKEHDAAAAYPVDRLPLLRPLMLPAPANILVSIYRLLVQDLVLYAKCLWKAANIVRKYKINTICVGELVTGSWLGFALRNIFGCKVIIYVHGEEVTTQSGGRLHGNRRAHFLRFADKLVAVSSFTCDALTSDMGVMPTSLALIQNGVDTSRFTPGDVDPGFLASKGFAGKRIVLTVGRLVPRKGIDMAIRAMREVAQHIPNVHHLIVGDGEYRAELLRIIEQEQMGDIVTLLGKTTDQDLLNYLRSCEVFLMPNRTMPDGDTEGFGLVFREANACGKPVVGGRAGGAVEAVVDGETGLLVDGNDVKDIASALIRLLTDHELANAMGIKGLKLASENNTQAVSDRFLKVCERLLHATPMSYQRSNPLVNEAP